MMITDINEDELAVGDRVTEPYGDSFPRVGYVDYIGADGYAFVVFDGDADAYAIHPTRLELVAE